MQAFDFYVGKRFVLILDNLPSHCEGSFLSIFPHTCIYLPHWFTQLGSVELAFIEMKREARALLKQRLPELNETGNLLWGADISYIKSSCLASAPLRVSSVLHGPVTISRAIKKDGVWRPMYSMQHRLVRWRSRHKTKVNRRGSSPVAHNSPF